MKLSYCPQVKVVHTSRIFHGQLYVPFLNWILMCGTILVTAVYSNTTRLGNAYGVCVMFVTFFDSLMVTLVALIVWGLNPLLVLFAWLFFACLDGLYLSSALTKVPEGAWFTLTISGILTCIFLLWRFGKENQWRAEAEDRFQPSNLLSKTNGGTLRLTERWGGDELSVVRGFGIFFDKTGVMTPSVFTHFASKFVAVTDVMVFFHLHPVEAPSVPDDERYSVSRFTAIPGCYRLVVKHGFMDEVISPDLAALIYEQLRKFVIRQASGKIRELDLERVKLKQFEREANGDEAVQDETTGCQHAPGDAGGHPQAAVASEVIALRDPDAFQEMARLDRAYGAKILYVVGKEQMRVRASTRFSRRLMLGMFLWIRDNTRAKIANLRLSMDRVVEVGFVKDI